MEYYDRDDKRGRVWGIVGVMLYFVVCAGVMFISYTIAVPEPEMGILVDFGTADSGFGDEDLAAGDVQPSAPPVLQPPADADRIATTDDAEAEVTVPETRPDPVPTTPTPRPTEQTPQPEPVREPDRRALFPGRTEGSTSASQGMAGGSGNQGSPDGGPGGGDSAGGGGSSGFSLAGRYMVGNLPLPAYNVEVEGRVVIRITVNGAGVVTGAVYEQSGSTTNHGDLVTAARNAALRARFTPSDAEVQTGTITYIFRLN